MYIVEVSTGKIYQVEISPVTGSDYRRMTKTRYFFDWNKERKYRAFKLTIVGSDDILGLISIEMIVEEWRIHIRLLTVSKENRGNKKKYERIAGNLISQAAKIAVLEFGPMACVSLKPKTELAKHYVNKYGMNITGMSLSLEVPEILNLINEYDDGQ